MWVFSFLNYNEISHLLIGFIDHDMAMQFMGGGIGHKATNAFTQAFACEVQNWEMNPVDNIPLEDKNEAEDLEEGVGDVVEEDYRYVINSDNENSDEEDEDDKDLGREDGDEP